MRTIAFNINSTVTRLYLGVAGEQNATQVVIDCNDYAKEYGEGTAVLLHKRAVDSVPYECLSVSQANNIVTWTITVDDTAYNGEGQLELRWTVDNVLKKSKIISTFVKRSLTQQEEEEIKSALELILEAIPTNVDRALEEAKESGDFDGVGISNIELNDDYTLTVTLTDGTAYTTDPIRGEKGEKGDKGDTGDNGVSTTVEVTADTDSDYRLTFTDVNGSIETPNLYSDVTASAKQLLSDSYTLDQVPYLFRKSPDSDRAVESIVGVMVGWNQLIQNGDFSDGTTEWLSNNSSISASNNVCTMLASAANSSMYRTVQMVKDHKYILRAVVKTDSNQVRIAISGVGSTYASGTGAWESISKIIPWAANTGAWYVQLQDTRTSGWTNVQSKAFILTDLTTMLGTTIADYIYSLEQSTAGAGVAKLKEWGFFTEDYYEYCEPTLRSVEGLVSKKTVGFNQWDEEWEVGDLSNSGQPITASDRIRTKNFIHVIPSTTYYFKAGVSGQTSWQLFGCYYDEDKNFISTFYKRNDSLTVPSNCHYIKWTTTGGYGTTYNHDICINLSDPTRNGQYEPYESHSYPLDSTLTLRGVPKLDSNNNLYFDGDVYSADGSVSRRFTERAYQSGDESLADAITDGTTTVVKLATPTTFTATPYHNPQIVGDTEEFVTTGIVPVGHRTKYYHNLRKKIEGLPWNFATLIAPTEVTNKATRNYTTGSYLILNNVLYKVTSNIANGGTITPSTNCTATTIMAEFMSL